jgi:GNAT superfamily N-acetyltransferase
MLAMFPIATGLRAWIEDVVVDQAARGRGVGAELTSRPSRRYIDWTAERLSASPTSIVD